MLTSDGVCASSVHHQQNANSDHEPAADGFAHAFDLTHDPAHGVDTYLLADLLRRRASAGRETRIKYVISNRRIASPQAGWAWRAYDGTNPHDKHMHVSVTPEATHDTTPWFAFLDPPASPPEVHPVTGVRRIDIHWTGTGHGYWVLFEDGGVANYGDARDGLSTFGAHRAGVKATSFAFTPGDLGCAVLYEDGHVDVRGNAVDLGEPVA